MAIDSISPATSSPSAQDAYGLDFQSLLKIILTQLTYQDPLKPVDNFQFVSQLAQFSQLQQSQTLNDQVTNLLASQAASQATGLLGRTVNIRTSATTELAGVVKAISFTSAGPTVTILTSENQTIANISIADIANIR